MCVCVCVCLCVCYIIILDMFRAVLCSSSGGRIITASGIVTLCKQLYSTPVESSLLSTDVLYSCLQTVTLPDAVIIQFDLLKMSKVLLETRRGL